MQLFTFWSFSPLTYIERLCLRSMLAVGHPVDLYTYDDKLDVPAGVTVKDAAEIVAPDRIFFHEPGHNPAPFSDLFRCEGLARGLGTWADCDMLFVRSIADMGEHIFGWQDENLVNTAVLRLPADCPLLPYVRRLAGDRIPIPRHWHLTKKIKQLVQRRPLGQLEKSVIGPLALTDYLRRSGKLVLAQEQSTFYPLSWRNQESLTDPAAHIESMFTERTRAVHLWNTGLNKRGGKKQPPTAGSFLARMNERLSDGPSQQ